MGDAFDLMMLRIGRRLPEARLLGVYVERMCPPGREVIMGMTRDPQFGPMLMFGLGGIFVEVMKDVAFHLAPITAQEALDMLEHTKSYALLEGRAGQGRVDVRAIADCLQRLSQLVTDFPVIEEMDINPLIVGQPGAIRWWPTRGSPCRRRGAAHERRHITLDPQWKEKYRDMLVTPAAALAELHPGKRVFVGTGCASPRSWSRRWWPGRRNCRTPRSSTC